MLTRLPAARSAPDACPGALRPHSAADGQLIRVRAPGGRLDAAALRALRAIALEHGDGRIGLTSRANLQLRGLPPEALPAVAAGLVAAGLLPDAEHELVRNILGSPLSGRLPGAHADIDGLVTELDAALCADPELAGLPGRFLFAVDDGRGDLAGAGADVRLVALAGGRFGVDVAGAGGPVVARAEAVPTALGIARGFLAVRGDAWRIAELPGGPAALLAGLDLSTRPLPEITAAPAPPVLPGLVEQVDGRFAVCAVVPLGRLDADAADALAAVTELAATELAAGAQARLTTSRQVVVPDLELPAALAARELLAASGLVVVPGSGWDRLTACAGRPGCAKSRSDVHADARAMAPQLTPVGPAIHLAGCDRCCGAPAGATRLVATGAGYQEQEQP